MIKVGDRFIDLSPEHLLLCAQIGVEGGGVRLECFPGFNEQGKTDPSELKKIIAGFKELEMDVPVIEMWHTDGVWDICGHSFRQPSLDSSQMPKNYKK